MNIHPKRAVSAILSAVMLLGIASPPVQALGSSANITEETDPRLCSHHEAHTEECGGLTGDCTFVCPEHTPQVLPELHEDMTDGTQSETPEQSETPTQPDGSEQTAPSVPTEPSAQSETIPAMTLTPAKPVEDAQSDALEVLPEDMPPMMLMARAKTEVYTSATSGNHVHSGDGSYHNPYNLFDDAVKNTMPGGTIIIKNKAFLNTLDEYGSKPYIIDKPLTITSEYADSPAMLQVRSGGIVLGGDVTFENVNLNFENRVHDAIFANGHTLELINVSRSNGSREVDLFGGQLYDEQSKRAYALDKKGTNSKILIQMDDPKLAQHSSVHFGNIYAGSMNGSFDGNVTVSIESKNYTSDKFIGEVYASGADATPPGNMLDIVEPVPPKANPAYITGGTVTFDFDSLPLRFSNSVMVIDGNTGAGGGKTSLSVSVPSPTGNLELKNISSLTVNKGTIQPSTLTGKDNTNPLDSITIKNDAGLDLSKSNQKDFTTGILSGQGTLILKRDGSLNVTTTFNDSTLTFQTEGAWNGKSGIVIADHTYVTIPSGSNGGFNFSANQAQDGWTFTNAFDSTKWTATKSGDAQDIPLLKHLDIDPNNAHKTINQSYFIHGEDEVPPADIEFPLIMESADSTEIVIEDYSFDYQINGRNIPDGEDDESRLSIYALTSTTLSKPVLQIASLDFAPLDPGEYIITLSSPSTSGELLQATAYLTITEDPPTPPKNPDSGASNSMVRVKKLSPTNFGNKITVEAAITQAMMLSTRAIDVNNAYLYVNGNAVGSPTPVTAENISFSNISVTPENGFRAGDNQVTVVYGGGTLDSAQFKGSTGTANIIVTKADPKVEMKDSAITKVYDGIGAEYTPNHITVTVPNLTISNPKFSVIHKKDGTTLDQPPVLPGTYTTQIQVAEGDTYQTKTIDGPQITIQKATPKISISHSFSENGKLILQAIVQGSDKGIIPTGKVTFTVSSATKEIPLNYGIATVEIEKPPVGNHTIQATYTPSNGSEDIYDSPQKPTETTIKIESNHKSLTGITLNKQTLVLKQGNSADLNVTFQPHDASNQNLTWISTDQTVATVENGKVTAKTAGTTTIEARSVEGGHVAFCVVTVSEQDVAVQKVTIKAPNTIMAPEQVEQLSAIIEPYNATMRDVSWKSDSENVLVDATTGKITAKKKGSATIIAEVGGKQATCTITVNDKIPVADIKLDSETLSLKARQTVLLTANITPDNATNADVTWKSNSPDLVHVDATTGWVTAKQKTTTPVTITATTTDGSKREATCKITVTEATGADIPVDSISISPRTLTLNIDQKETLRAVISPSDATNQKVTWKSEKTNIATVDENTGEVTGVAAGDTKIIATSTANSQKSASITVTVKGKDVTPPPKPTPKITITPNKLSLKVGDTGKFNATVEHGTSNNVTWTIKTTSGENVIQINSSTGDVTALKPGNVTVKATYTASPNIEVSATATVEVTPKQTPSQPTISITPDSLSLKVGQKDTFNATVTGGTSNTVTWEIVSGNEFISLNTSTGEVTANKVGTATVKATYTQSPNIHVSKTATVEVSEAIPPVIQITSVKIDGSDTSLKTGAVRTFTAKVLPTEAPQTVTWSASPAGILSVDANTGRVTALKAGQVTLTATSTVDSQKSDSITVTVANIPVTEVKIMEAPLSLREGDRAKLTIRVSPADATNPEVKWESNDTHILTVDQDGYITARNKGVATITVTSVAQPEKKDSRMISVTASSSGGGGGSGGGGSSGGGSSHKPSKPDKKPTKPEPKPETKPVTPPAIPPSVKPQQPTPGVPVITTAPPVNPTLNTSFADIPQTHWASEPIRDVVSRGLFVGTEPDEFSPNESMSRAMVVTVLHRLAGEPAVQAVNQFTDVGRTYYTDAVTWASQNHIVSGTSANTFSPNLMVTREELVVMLYRLANPTPDTGSKLTGFSDTAKVSSWASAPMQWAVKNEILKGSDGALLPQQKLTRAEAASLIYRFSEKILHI